MGAQNGELSENASTDALTNTLRTLTFWRRACGVYLAYKGAQGRAELLKRFRGWDDARLTESFWRPHHDWAGREFYSMAVDLRGFYLKLGQFFAARAEFVPAPICLHLAKLHDQVPPMPPAQARRTIERELGGAALEDVFAWIDLDKPLGSASIAQVHKGKLRAAPQPQRHRRGWLQRLCLGLRWRGRAHGQQQRWQDPLGDAEQGYSGEDFVSERPLGPQRPALSELPEMVPAKEAAAAACSARDGPTDGIVAVKVQYPNALPTMRMDLAACRKWAAFLQRTEIAFDMKSAVDELAKQVVLEFDFRREARVMDAIAGHLRDLRHWVEIPRSVPGLVTRRLLVMTFLEGTQITQARHKLAGLSPRQRRAGKKRILRRVGAAYGAMMLREGLFQADAHPGNIMVMKGARVGLLDYGQSKQLPERERLAFAALLLQLGRGRQRASPEAVTAAVLDLGLRFGRIDPRVITKMAFGMFDTQVSHKVDPFSPNSPLKSLAVEHFPPEVFFVLRNMQLLRGLAGGMDDKGYSAAQQWQGYARQALRRARRKGHGCPAQPQAAAGAAEGA